MTVKTWTIRPWDCEKQKFGPERQVTLEQFLAETKAACARAAAIHKQNRESVR